ncbi:MAG: hypothetical protein U1E76_13670 [Planctomycetota bacterium]
MSIRAFADHLKRVAKAWYHQKVGRFYFHRGDLSRARDHFLTAIKANEACCAAHLYLFEIYVFQKRFGKAMEELAKARELDPKQCDSYHLRPDHLMSFAEYLRDSKQVSRLSSRRTSAGLLKRAPASHPFLPFGDFVDRYELERFEKLPPISEQDISKIDWDDMSRYLLEGHE